MAAESRFHGCWKTKPRPRHISPCGYERNLTDPACRGCADQSHAHYREVTEDILRVAESWAKRQPWS